MRALPFRRHSSIMSSTLPARRSSRLSNAGTDGSESKPPAAAVPAPNSKKPRARKAKDADGPVPEAASTASAPMPPPATPPAKRSRKAAPAAKVPPPTTPTPAAIRQIAGLHTASDIDDALPPVPPPQSKRRARPAEPHATNAPLSTPRGSRVVSYAAPGTPPASQAATIAASPSKPGVPTPTTTTANLLSDACAHLVAVDPRMASLVARHHCQIFAPEGLAEPVDPFRALCSGIMAQQVSGAAASSIKRKFMGLFNEPPPVANGVGESDEGKQSMHETDAKEREKDWLFPTFEQVAKADLALLRTAGLSGRKAEYIKGMAEKFESGELSAKMLVEASYDEVLEKLTAVRGLGRWSVEMFACFALKRMDVFSTGDLGVQ